MKRILVDMDGVIADFGEAFDRRLDLFPKESVNIPRRADVVNFDMNTGRTAQEKALIGAIFIEPGFYADLVPIEGAKEALKQMASAGYDVRIVSSPWISNPTCASDKLNWVLKYYGQSWATRTIITTDKTLVRGDYLIDDKPEVRGSEQPEWTHVLYDQPYNQGVEKPRIIDWSDWRSVIE